MNHNKILRVDYLMIGPIENMALIMSEALSFIEDLLIKLEVVLTDKEDHFCNNIPNLVSDDDNSICAHEEKKR